MTKAAMPRSAAILWRVFRQMRSVGGAATDHAAAIHVRGGVARIHAAHVRAQWNRISMRIHLLVVEVIVPLRIKRPSAGSSFSGASTSGAPLRQRPISFAATNSCSSGV